MTENTEKYLKMKDSTTSDNTHLCKSCRHGIVTKFTNNVVKTGCTVTNLQINNNVAECSAYYNKNLPSLQTFYDVAFILETKKSGKLGFSRYTEWKENNKKEADDVLYS